MEDHCAGALNDLVIEPHVRLRSPCEGTRHLSPIRSGCVSRDVSRRKNIGDNIAAFIDAVGEIEGMASARPRKRHVQLSLLNATGTKRADPRRGKARGGRPRKRPRGCPPHTKREQFRANQPVHVTLRVLDSVGSLRRRFLYAALRAATFVAATKHAARIIHISIQKNHIISW